MMKNPGWNLWFECMCTKIQQGDETLPPGTRGSLVLPYCVRNLAVVSLDFVFISYTPRKINMEPITPN